MDAEIWIIEKGIKDIRFKLSKGMKIAETEKQKLEDLIKLLESLMY